MNHLRWGIILSLICILGFCIVVNGESEEWVCPDCGKIASGFFCMYCGKPKPGDEWVCPTCGTTAKGDSCIICGTAKPEELADWHNNLLKEDRGIQGKLKTNMRSTKPVETIFGVDAWKRNQIKAVYVLDTLEGMPLDAVDISAAQNGSVMGWLDQNQELYIAGNGGVMAPKNSTALFAWLENASIIDFGGNFHTDETTNLGFFVGHCPALVSLNLEGIVTDKVTRFTKMFAGCRSLRSIDLHGFDTQKAKSFFGMFWNCVSLETLDLTSFQSSRVSDFQIMFRGCKKLKRIIWIPQEFSTKKATDFGQMFLDCKSLESLDVSMFDTSSVTNMYMMFANCASLLYLDTSGWNVSSVEHHGDMFAGAALEPVLGLNGELLFE